MTIRKKTPSRSGARRKQFWRDSPAVDNRGIGGDGNVAADSTRMCIIPDGAGVKRLTDDLDDHPHWCHPLSEPEWFDALQASYMRPEDPVLGIALNDHAWALPWWVMKNHHVANLTLDGVPMLVVLCEVCSSAAAFDPVIGGRRHTFRLGGMCNGTIMPEDYETGSLWRAFSGQAFQGPLMGRAMERLPLLMCTWEEWRQMHPHTLVVSGVNETREGHGEGNSPGSPYVGPFMAKLLAFLDTRLPHYELVLGVRAGGDFRCYPLAAIGAVGGVIDDDLGGEKIVVIARPGTWMASAFSRQIDDRILTFESCDGNVVDAQTGSRWDISGRAIAGSLQGRQLKFVHSGVEEYFIWAAFNPGTGIYGLAEVPVQQEKADALLDTVPAMLRDALQSGRVARGTRTLVAGCGDGMIAAFLAEYGLEVTCVDSDTSILEAARSRFRGVRRLALHTGSLQNRLDEKNLFDFVVDLGTFASTPVPERSRFVSNLAAVCRKGAKVMVVLPPRPANPETIRVRLQRRFAPAFRLVGERKFASAGVNGARGTIGMTFAFVRS